MITARLVRQFDVVAVTMWQKWITVRFVRGELGQLWIVELSFVIDMGIRQRQFIRRKLKPFDHA